MALSACFSGSESPNLTGVSVTHYTISCRKSRRDVEYYSVCLCSHADSMASVGVSNSCLYHHSSSGSGRQIRH